MSIILTYSLWKKVIHTFLNPGLKNGGLPSVCQTVWWRWPRRGNPSPVPSVMRATRPRWLLQTTWRTSMALGLISPAPSEANYLTAKISLRAMAQTSMAPGCTLCPVWQKAQQEEQPPGALGPVCQGKWEEIGIPPGRALASISGGPSNKCSQTLRRKSDLK